MPYIILVITGAWVYTSFVFINAYCVKIKSDLTPEETDKIESLKVRGFWGIARRNYYERVPFILKAYYFMGFLLAFLVPGFLLILYVPLPLSGADFLILITTIISICAWQLVDSYFQKKIP